MQRLIQASQGSCGWAKLLAAGMFEEVGVHFVADAGVGVWHRPNGPEPRPGPGGPREH